MFLARAEGGGVDVSMVYLPGIEGSGALASKFLLKAEGHFPITRLHYPGHSRLTIEELADGCVSALAEQGKTSAIWLGDSFGSAVALAIALKHPRATRGLILAGGMTKAPSPVRLLAAARILDTLPSSWRKKALRRRLQRVVRRHPTRFHRSVVDEFLINGQLDFLSWRLRLLSAFNVRSELHKLDCPVLYLGGEEDGLVNTQEESRLLRATLPSCRTFLFPGCGHAVLGERAVECLEVIDLFIPMAKRVAA
ncbi:MAG: alpha/beta hydrolase [Candidatus Omnitrophica bacterium]|nr:alpha/beta hydrolase [Candidatus Omnitrophota bacterium]